MKFLPPRVQREGFLCRQWQQPPAMPMRLQTVQSTAIKVLFEALKDLLTDVNMTFDSTGMRLLAMDGAHVALVHVKLSAHDVEEYVCTQNYVIGVNMAALFKLLKTISNNDTISFEILDSSADELVITIENMDKNSVAVYKLKLLDIDEEMLNIPDVTFDSVISMPSNDFQRICRDMSAISETLVIETKGSELHIECTGEFASCSMNIGETTNGITFERLETAPNVKGTFALRYLNLFTKSTNLSNYVELYLKNSYPLILKYQVASLGFVRFCLAPKVSEEETTCQ